MKVRNTKVGISVKTANLDEETVFDVEELIILCFYKAGVDTQETFKQLRGLKITPEPE
jgi:hypothetical protein